MLVAIRAHPARTGECEQFCRSYRQPGSRIPAGIPSDGPPRRNLRGSRWRAADSRLRHGRAAGATPRRWHGLSGTPPQRSSAARTRPRPPKIINIVAGWLPPSAGRPTHSKGPVPIGLSAKRPSPSPVEVRLSGGSRWALVASITGSCAIRHRTARSCVHSFQQVRASSLHTKRTRLQHAAGVRIPANVNSVHDQSEYAAWDLGMPGCRVRSHLVRNLLRCRRAYPRGAVDLCWIRVRDRLLATLGASRTVSGPAGNSGRSPRLPQPSIPATLWPEPESDLRGFGSREPVRPSCMSETFQCVTLK